MPDRIPERVFVSYSREDKEWMERIRKQLSLYIDDGTVDLWIDESDIEPGDQFAKKIGHALETSSAAVLLVSPDFQSSNFIRKHELPRLRDGAEAGDIKLFWILVGDCPIKDEFTDFHAITDPQQPLETLDKGQVNFVLANFARKLRDHVLERRRAAESRQQEEMLDSQAKQQAPSQGGEAPSERKGGHRSGPHGMAFLPIRAGTFLMGSPESEEGRCEGEDLHEVAMTRDFEMAVTPVTQGQWEAVMGENPSGFAESGAEAPVEQVSWEDAKGFCERLSVEDAEYDYRLPTEAEWEYACRAGTNGPYNVEGAELGELGWYSKNSDGRTHSRGEKSRNAWGLHDMHGNVYEWCEDRYAEHLGTEPGTDPEGPKTGGSRVIRGGCWFNSAQFCRSAYRFGISPGDRSSHVGFRPVRQPKK